MRSVDTNIKWFYTELKVGKLLSWRGCLVCLGRFDDETRTKKISTGNCEMIRKLSVVQCVFPRKRTNNYTMSSPQNAMNWNQLIKSIGRHGVWKLDEIRYFVRIFKKIYTHKHRLKTKWSAEEEIKWEKKLCGKLSHSERLVLEFKAIIINIQKIKKDNREIIAEEELCNFCDWICVSCRCFVLARYISHHFVRF